MATRVRPSVLLRDALLMGLAYGTLSFLVIEAVAFGYPTGSVFWPGAGLTLGVLLVRPQHTWPALLAGVFVAEFLVDLTIPVSPGAALVWAVANTLEPTVGALLLTRQNRQVSLTNLPGLLRFLAIGVALGPAVGATVGATAAWAAGIDAFWPTWPRWWVGDSVGVLLIAPAIIMWRSRTKQVRVSSSERVWIIVGLLAVTGASLFPWPGETWQQGLPFLIAPTLVVVAMRIGPTAAATGLAVTGLVVNAVTASGIGPFAEYGTYGGLVVAQVCLAAAAFAHLTVMALSHNLITLRELSEHRTAIANILAHELKGPLMIITGHAELLEPDAPPDLFRSSKMAIDRGTRRIANIVDDMLVLAKVDDPNKPPDRTQVDLAELVVEAVDLNRATAEQDGVRLRTELGNDPIVVLGERGELDRMVLNLVSNAIKYTPAGGSVTISCSLDGEQAVFVCQDEGIGISSEDQARLFDEFFRSGDPAARARPGTGLGLSIVRRVVERHHGTITVDSELGAGSTFTVRIPTQSEIA